MNVRTLEAAGRPIYVQEGPRATLPGERFRGASCARATPEDNPFLDAVVEAKRAGPRPGLSTRTPGSGSIRSRSSESSPLARAKSTSLPASEQSSRGRSRQIAGLLTQKPP